MFLFQIYILDANNFFASSEAVFQPRLKGKPVVVLSNNDGCIIARSKEAKALGIPMGAPLFEWEHFLQRHGVECFSANFPLYSDLSQRVMEAIRSLGLVLEPYSIDETFVQLQTSDDLGIRERVQQWTGIPICIGVGKTKTQAKLANRLAKSASGFHVFQESDLETFPIEDVWGVGRKYACKLKSYGIYTAGDLVTRNDAWIRKQMTVMGLRMVWELRGTPCLKSEFEPPPKKGIVVSRSFKHAVTCKKVLSEAVMQFVAKAACKLRKDQGRAGYIQVFASGCHLGKRLPCASSYNPTLMSCARELLDQIYDSTVRYKRAGVMLTDITTDRQEDLLTASEDRDEMMTVMDAVNRRYGKEMLFYAAQGINQRWQAPLKQRTPHYTTQWSDILRVK